MSNSRTDTRKQILDCAETLMLSRGFNAFSYQHISSQLGVKNAAIHYHFPSKTDLGVAVIQRFRRRFARWTEREGQLTADPWMRLEWYFDLLGRYYDDDQKICPTGMLSAEFHALPEPMQAEAQAFALELINWGGDILRDGVERGYFRFPGSVADKTLQIFAALQGALQLARVQPAALDAVIKQIRLDLGAR